MNRSTSSRLFGAALLVAGVAGLHAQTSTVTVHDAWVREPIGARNMTAAYLIVENTGATPRAIVGASADVSGKVELHEMKMAGEVMSMSPVKSIPVPAKGKVELRPGSFHLMLADLKTKPAAGDKVRVTLTLDDGSTVSTEATVRRAEE